MPMKDDRLRVAHLCRVLAQRSLLGASRFLCFRSVRFIARGFLSLVPSTRVPPSPGLGTSFASTARDSRTLARLPSRYRTSCGIRYRWGRVSQLRSEIVPYGCSWVRVFGGERPCIDSRGHETRRVRGAGSSVVPDFPVARWIGYSVLKTTLILPTAGSCGGCRFPSFYECTQRGNGGSVCLRRGVAVARLLHPGRS